VTKDVEREVQKDFVDGVPTKLIAYKYGLRYREDVLAACRGLKEAKAKARFWRRCVPRSDSCWVWSGAVHQTGYGWTNSSLTKRRARTTHTLAWILSNERDIPPGMCVLHRCDVKLCCNPSHLYLGTQQQNVKDRESRARRPLRTGPKLSPTQKLYLLTDYKKGIPVAVLVDRYGVSANTINSYARHDRVPKRSSGRPPSPVHKFIVHFRKRGLSLAQIAKTVGCTVANVHDHLMREGMTKDFTHRRSALDTTPLDTTL
jgi:hypothetical protein